MQILRDRLSVNGINALFKPADEADLTFGQWFRKRRLELSLTQVGISIVLDVSCVTIQNWEKGFTLPSVATYKRICEKLDLQDWEKWA